MRLINADSLIDILLTENQRCITSTSHELTMNMIISFINAQPTAYDVDKVVKELKDTFERLVAEILDKTSSEYTIADFNIKPYSNRICEVHRKGGISE